jgi:hypothetical protein
MDSPVRSSPRRHASPLALHLPVNSNETYITPLPLLPPVLTGIDAAGLSLVRNTSSPSPTASSVLSSPAGQQPSRGALRRCSGADYAEEVAGACSSGEFEELFRKLNGQIREPGEQADYSPTFHMLQSLRRARTQDLVAKITRLRLIGEGGYGRVYQGMWQVRAGMPCVLSLLPAGPSPCLPACLPSWA